MEMADSEVKFLKQAGSFTSSEDKLTDGGVSAVCPVIETLVARFASLL
jgi:hypothetical protein